MLAGDFGFAANGNISPCRFCKIDTSADGLVLEGAASTDQTPFISQEGTRNVPYSTLNDGYAAIAGEPIKLFKIGEICLLETSAAVTRGARLKASAADGRGMTAAVGDAAYAIALKSSGGAAQKIPVLIIFDSVNT